MFGNLIFASILLISFGLLAVLLMSAAGVDFRSIFYIAEKTDSVSHRVGRRDDEFIQFQEPEAGSERAVLGRRS